MARQKTLYRVAQIFQQVPPVGDLGGLRGTLANPCFVLFGTVPTHSLCPWVRLQPSGDALSRAFREYIHWSMTVQVHHQRPVLPPARQRPVINANGWWAHY